MASDHTPPIQVESTRDMLDVLASSIAKTAVSQTKRKPQRTVPDVPVESSRELLTEKMLADRWVCSIARFQRWRTIGEGPPYLKIVGKMLYQLKDIEAYEEASLARMVFQECTQGHHERIIKCWNDLASVRNDFGGAKKLF